MNPEPGAPMSSRDDSRALLGNDLCTLARGVSAPLVGVAPLTTLSSGQSHRASFRLEFADGQLLKGRRFDSEEDARRVATLLPLLDGRFFPRLVATCGSAAVLEWVEGEPLGTQQCHEGRMEEMGGVHARLHGVAVPRRSGHAGSDAADWPVRLARYLNELVAGGFIDGRTRARVETVIGTATPLRFPAGLVHKDFCLENMVVSPNGDVRIVDNETVTVDCADFDLARTWYRWPMTPSQATAYLAGYRHYRAARTLERDFPFWVVAVLASSALFRLRRGIDAAVPLHRLRALAARHEASGELPTFIETRRPGREDVAPR